MTYTLARLPVPRAVWDLIAAKLRATGIYDHAIHDDGTIDMTHLGLEVEPTPIRHYVESDAGPVEVRPVKFAHEGGGPHRACDACLATVDRDRRLVHARKCGAVQPPTGDPFDPLPSPGLAPMTEAEVYLGRAIRSLYLELPAAIADEVKRAVGAVLGEARSVRCSAVDVPAIVNAINCRIDPSQWTADIEAAVQFALLEVAGRSVWPAPPPPPPGQELPLAIALVDPRVVRGERWIRGGSARGDWQIRADGHTAEIRHYEHARESADGLAVGWLPWQRCDIGGAGPFTLADLRAPVLGIIEPTEAAP